jgi:autotransporter-associated beta strand protein
MNKFGLTLCVAMAAIGSQAQVTNFTWTGASSGLFSTAGNWLIDQPAPGSAAPRAPSSTAGNDFAVFQGSVTARTIDVAATARNVRGLQFNAVAGANAFTFNANGVTTQTSFGFNLRQDGIVNNDDDSQVFNAPIKLFTYAGGNAAITTLFTFNAAAGGLNFSGNFINNSTKAALDLNGGQLTIDGSFNTTIGGVSVPGLVASTSGSGRIVKNGAGTLTLAGTMANTYIGGTLINNGVVNANKANALGSGFVSLTGGTLNIGANNQTVGAVTNAGGTINGSGTITGSSYRLAGGTVNPTLAGVGINLIQLSGTSVLAGNNTYSGTTTISGGTLQLGAAERIADTSNLILNGGTLDTAGFSETLGTLSLTADSSIDLGSGSSALVFADSSALLWNAFSLDIANWTPGNDTIRFGLSDSALTPAQLAQIRFLDYGNAPGQLDPSGFLSPAAVPEPSSTALALLGGIALFFAMARKRLV